MCDAGGVTSAEAFLYEPGCCMCQGRKAHCNATSSSLLLGLHVIRRAGLNRSCCQCLLCLRVLNHVQARFNCSTRAKCARQAQCFASAGRSATLSAFPRVRATYLEHTP